MIRRWNDTGWRKRFALFPICLSDGPERTMIWLQWVWVRDAALYREVSIHNPAKAMEAGTAETSGSVHDSAVAKAIRPDSPSILQEKGE